MFKNKFIFIGLIILVILGVIVATIISLQNRVKVASFKPVTLEYWGVWEQPEDIYQLTAAYTARHPQVTIRYRQFRAEEYADQLLKAWALDQGPDIFMIPNTWMREYQQYSAPMPPIMSVPVQYQTGTIKKEVVTRLQQYQGYTTKQLRDLFLDVVYKDVLLDNKIYALPLSVDTMVMYYNRALLQANGIAEPAKTWKDIVDQAAKISKLNSDNQFLQSTIALGSTTNIPNSFDIVSLLMQQVGVTMTNGDIVSFSSGDKAVTAIDFYLNFSRPNTTVYSWNKDQANALDVFTAGQLAYFLGYPYHANLIKQNNPKLDWDVVPVPQAEGAQSSQTFANYWVNAVAKKSKNQEIAWQAIYEMTQADNVQPYLERTSKTTALRSLVAKQQVDLKIGPFAQNLLQAQSWYRGYNFPLAQKYFLDMIDSIAMGKASTHDAINNAETQIRRTYQAPQQP